MRSSRILIAFIGCSLLMNPSLPAQAAAAAPARADAIVDTTAILASARPEIEAANAAWLPGLRNRDAQAIAAAYADSGLFIAPDGSVTRGREAIARMYAARFPKLRAIRFGAVVQGGLTLLSPTRIAEWGQAWLEMESRAKGGPPVRSGGSYLTVWQRESDGHWRIVRNLAL
jgi:uncharacterized protein (TIGR02246 family)